MEHSEEDLLDPPKFDTLCVQFRGDNHTITLPYCEVANGNILSVDDHKVTITLHTINKEGETNIQEVAMPHQEFVDAVEEQFAIKQITKLSIQKADSYDVITIL
jgi:hypothetical protein